METSNTACARYQKSGYEEDQVIGFGYCHIPGIQNKAFLLFALFRQAEGT